MKRARVLMELAPWAGLVGAALGWALDHQVGGDGIFYDCRRGAVWTTIVGLACLVLALASGFAALRLWRHGDETPARRFLALIGALFAALLLIAILLSTIAGLILPECLA